MTTDQQLYTFFISLFLAALVIVWLSERKKDRRKEQQREADRLTEKWRQDPDEDNI